MPPEQQLYWLGMYLSLLVAWSIANRRRRSWRRKPFFVEPTLEILFGLVTIGSGAIAVITMASLATGVLAMFAGLYLVSEGSEKFAAARKEWKYETEREQYQSKPNRWEWLTRLQKSYKTWQANRSVREYNATLERETLRQKTRLRAEAEIAAENAARQKAKADTNQDSVAVGLPE